MTTFKEVLRDYRRDQIVDTARRLFEERRSTEVSMDEIAAEAGVARSTVYVYFTNRDELLLACLQRMQGLLDEAIAPAWSRDLDPVVRLRTFVRGMFERIDENPAFFRLAVITAATSRDPASPIGAELALIGLNVVSLLVDMLTHGMETGRFRAVEADRAANFIGQQLYGAMSVRADEPAPLPLDEATAELCDFVVNGLATNSAPSLPRGGT